MEENLKGGESAALFTYPMWCSYCFICISSPQQIMSHAPQSHNSSTVSTIPHVSQ